MPFKATEEPFPEFGHADLKVRKIGRKDEVARLIKLRGYTIGYVAELIGSTRRYVFRIAHGHGTASPAIAAKIFKVLMLAPGEQRRLNYFLCRFEQRLARLVGWTLVHWDVEPDDLARALRNARDDLISGMSQKYLGMIVGKPRRPYKRESWGVGSERDREREECGDEQNLASLKRQLKSIIDARCEAITSTKPLKMREAVDMGRAELLTYFVAIHPHHRPLRLCRQRECVEALRLCGVMRRAPTPADQPS